MDHLPKLSRLKKASDGGGQILLRNQSITVMQERKFQDVKGGHARAQICCSRCLSLTSEGSRGMTCGELRAST